MKIMITGALGQDGLLLTRNLLHRGVDVYGICKTVPEKKLGGISEDLGSMNLVGADVSDYDAILSTVTNIKPDVIFNFAGKTSVGLSWKNPREYINVNTIGCANCLEAIREGQLDCKFFQAGSAQQFGGNRTQPLSEDDEFFPENPYAVSKVLAHEITRHYREYLGVHATNVILFAHESSLRSSAFLSKKISHGVAEIANGIRESISVGNTSVIRDWGYAPDYVNFMADLISLERGEDLVLATGRGHSVEEMIEFAFAGAGIDLIWEGSGVSRNGIDQNGIVRVDVDSQFYRPDDQPYLVGDPTRASELIEWSPSIDLREMMKLLVEFELRAINK